MVHLRRATTNIKMKIWLQIKTKHYDLSLSLPEVEPLFFNNTHKPNLTHFQKVNVQIDPLV